MYMSATRVYIDVHGGTMAYVEVYMEVQWHTWRCTWVCNGVHGYILYTRVYMDCKVYMVKFGEANVKLLSTHVN